jgi:hypothetical protein
MRAVLKVLEMSPPLTAPTPLQSISALLGCVRFAAFRILQ